MPEQQEAEWVPPEGAICCEDGCSEPAVALRPSVRDYLLENEAGEPVAVLAAGEVDETVCAAHAVQQEEPE